MTKKNLIAVLILAAAAAGILVTVQHRRANRGGEDAVTIDPAVERETAERDRAILTTGLAAAFPAWLKKWRTGERDLDPAALQQDGIESIDDVFDIQEDEVRLPDDDESLKPLISPDGSRYLEYGGGEGGEPDSELTVVDTAKKERKRLLFTGPEARIEDAAWADKDTVIAVGSEEAEKGAKRPLVWIFHLKQRLVSTYTDQ